VFPAKIILAASLLVPCCILAEALLDETTPIYGRAIFGEFYYSYKQKCLVEGPGTLKQRESVVSTSATWLS
jgi:hypothetical protein